MKKIIALLLVLVLAMTCVACAAGGANKRTSTNGKKDNSLTLAVQDQVTTFDPYLFKLAIEDAVNSSIYEPLFYVDNDGEYIWCVAESLDMNDDNSVTVHLKKDLKFHSGDTLTAEDVLYSFGRTAYSTAISALSQTIVMSEIDEYTVKMEFPMAAEGYGYDALRPYLLMMKIMNKSFCEGIIASPDQDMKFETDGTGPYKLVSHNETGDVTLTKFDGYYQDVAIETINFKYISGDLEAAFEAGDIDMTSYSSSNFQKIKEYENVGTMSFSVNNVTMLVNNCTDASVMADPTLREAITYAMNRQDVCTIGSAEGGSVAYNLANPQIDHYVEGTVIEQNQDKAKELMAAAGYSESNPCKISLIVLGAQTDWVAGCEVLKEMLDACYFDVTIEQVADTSRYFTYDFDLALIGIALTTNFNSYSSLFDMASGLDLAGIEDAEITAAFAAMDGSAETAQNAMKAATASNAYIPLWYNTYFYAYDKDLNVGAFYNEMSAFLYREFSWNK